MSKWIITIDQSTTNGCQRYGPYVEKGLVSDAVEEALDAARLIHVEHGAYQITVTPYSSKDLKRISRLSKDSDGTS